MSTPSDDHLRAVARVMAEILNERDPDRHWTVAVEGDEDQPLRDAA